MSKPLISIIIPTYNRAHLLGETLSSISKQTYTNWECIVVDDGSSDGTAKLLAAYCENDKRFQYHHRPKDMPKGANACRNYGFELSEGEYVNWFDDDDVMLELFLEEKVNLFNKDLKLVICSGYYVNEKLQNKEEIFLSENMNLFKDYVLWNLHILTPSILFRKSFLIDKDLFSYNIVRGQETQLFSRLFFGLKSSEYKIINKQLFLYRQHQRTKTYISKKEYNKKAVNSQTIIAFENLERAKRIGDIELKSVITKNLLYFFFRGLDNNHFKNSKKILNKLPSYLSNGNFIFVQELKACGYLLLLIKRGSYRIERRIMNYKIK